MRICVYGAGAIGGHLAAKLAAAGNDVAVIARGAQLAAIERNGIVLKIAERRVLGRVRAAACPEALGPQDIVISSLKAPSLPGLAAAIGPLLGPDTGVVFAQNGIPWWYPHELSPARPRPPDLARLDPGGALLRAVGPGRAIGAVIHSSNEVVEPGVISNDPPYASTLIVGEADDRDSARVRALRSALRAAGIDSPDVGDIRKALWTKLLMNMSGSTLCLLTGQRAPILARDPRLNAVWRRLVGEAAAIAAAHGIELGAEAAHPTGGTREPPDHKPSILQDYERGRAMEIDAIVMAPQLFARAAGLDTPVLDTVAAIAARLAAAKGLYADPARNP
jgi:2-dehydropantoate 2-reductase